MRKVLLVLASVFVLLVAVPFSSYAAPDVSWSGLDSGARCMCESGYGQGGMMGGRMGMFAARRQMMWKIFKKLGLSRPQMEAIWKVRSGLRKDAIMKKADIEVARVELMNMLHNGFRKDHVDMAAVEAKLKQIASLQTELRLARIKAFVAIRSELTPEQCEKVRENMAGF